MKCLVVNLFGEHDAMFADVAHYVTAVPVDTEF